MQLGYIKGYKSSRGKQLTGKLVERMMAKRKISEERGSIKKVEYGGNIVDFHNIPKNYVLEIDMNDEEHKNM